MRACTEFSSIYLYRDAIDFRKSINGLVALVEGELCRCAFEPALYLFCNKRRDKLKMLYWDNTGFALWYKRLERDRFKWPKAVTDKSLILTDTDVYRLLAGYDVIGHRQLNYASHY
jgi:transposase